MDRRRPGATDPPRTIELKAHSPNDPDGAHTAAVLAAYLRAEQMAIFRRLLWRRLAVAASVWLLLGAASIVPFVGVIVGTGLMLVVAIAAGIADWRARTLFKQLTRS